MDLMTALLLIALTLVGIGLFVRAWTRGMAFGERLEERQREGPGGGDAVDDPAADR